MPFNLAIASGGRRTFPLAITAEDLALNYNVEAEVVSQYGLSTAKNDVVVLTIAAVDLVAASTSGYAIDADGLHDEAEFKLVLTTGCLISGRGANGGDGGRTWWDAEESTDLSSVGSVGSNGGSAIRYGCPTTISGTGTIRKGYGGGGGGGGGAVGDSNDGGGGGGGGGAPLGDGGDGGLDFGLGSNVGDPGSAATVTTLGDGGLAGGTNGGDGGDGGDSTPTAQQNGSIGTKSGGAAGSDGDAIHTQTFDHSAGDNVTITGDII